MMRKKIVSLCMALALCLSLLPVTALAAEGAPSSLYVGNQQVISGNDITYWTTGTDGKLTASNESGNWNVKYDPSTVTLSLQNAKISGGNATTSPPYGAGIYALSSSGQPVALTIELIGENTITGTFGIYVNATTPGTDASLVIQKSGDNGSLTVTGTDSYGLYIASGTGNASLTIKNVSVVANATSSYSGSGVCVQSGASATDSPNISLSVDGGSLTASGTGSNDGILFYVGQSQATGATTSLTVSNNAIVDARNGGISASRISVTLPTPTPTGDNRSGIVFDGSTGTVYGSVTLQEDLTIGEGESLTIPDGSSLDMDGHTITVESGGKLDGKPTGEGTVKIAPTITTESLPDGEAGTAYSQALAATGDPTITWNVPSGTLPAGLTLDTNTGTISGTPTTANTYNFTVTATNDSGNDSKQFSLTIDPKQTVSVTGVTLDQAELSLYTGESKTLIATVQPSDATIQNVTWESSNTEVATVDANGKVTAEGEGEATITVTTADGGKTATCAVTVTAAPVPVSGVSLNKDSTSLTVGDTETLTATITPDNATNKNVTWSSDTPSVASVNNGVVTAVAPGTATITVTTADGGFTATCAVTVRPDIPPANPNYRITVEATQGGTVTADPTAAKAGTTVTLTPAPDAGYQVGTVAVTDRFGEAVAVTEQAGGTYTFTMPNGQVTVTVTFAEAPLPFPDVTEGDWFYDAVRYAYETGLMDGVGDSLFAPNSQTTRAQLVTILYRLAGEPEPGGDSGFSDVAAGTWYTDAVAWAAQNGIVNGTTDTTFAPGDDITREQLAAILYRYAAYQGYDVSQRADLSGFGDASSIRGYAQEALSWAHAQGLVLGFEDGSLRPQGTASRAQIAAVLMRFLAAVPAE